MFAIKIIKFSDLLYKCCDCVDIYNLRELKGKVRRTALTEVLTRLGWFSDCVLYFHVYFANLCDLQREVLESDMVYRTYDLNLNIIYLSESSFLIFEEKYYLPIVVL